MIILIFAGSRMSMIRRELPRSTVVNHDALCRNSQGRGFSFQVPEPSTDGTAAPFISRIFTSRMHDLADGPDEAHQLTSDGHGGHR